MTTLQGSTRKMHVSTNDAHLVQYQLPVGDEMLDINPLIGKTIKVTHSGDIHCVHCQSKTKKSFNQGYCYRCLITLAQCDSCIIKPELCHYHEGTCREPEWGEENCMNDHFVYLANTGTVKVGITRHVTGGISSRWIDQGASQAIPILRVQNRLLSGLVETVFKAHIADKTNWRTMLKAEPEYVDLASLRDSLMREVTPELEDIVAKHGLQAITTLDNPAVSIRYPVEQYPDKVKSINLDKSGEFEGTLLGVKGQYWMLDGDRVINMRKYAGYDLQITVQ